MDFFIIFLSAIYFLNAWVLSAIAFYDCRRGIYSLKEIAMLFAFYVMSPISFFYITFMLVSDAQDY